MGHVEPYVLTCLAQSHDCLAKYKLNQASVGISLV